MSILDTKTQKTHKNTKSSIHGTHTIIIKLIITVSIISSAGRAIYII